MTGIGRTIAAVGLVTSASIGCTAKPHCDLGAHKWKQSSSNSCGESFWTFVPAGNGVWSAKESGCAGATGTAKYDGVTVTLDLQYGGGAFTGRYEWPLDGQCHGTTGKVMGTNGGIAGPSLPSTLSIAP